MQYGMLNSVDLTDKSFLMKMQAKANSEAWKMQRIARNALYGSMICTGVG